MNKNFKVNYLSRDFSSIKEELKKYASRYYKEELADLSEASINSFLIDSIAYVGDVLSYYLDFQTNETFLSNAIEQKNILKLARTIGYKTRDNASSCGKLAFYLKLPEKNGKPDFLKAPTILKGSTFTSLTGNYYISTEDVTPSSVLTGEKYVVSETNINGYPTFFTVKTYIPIVSGRVDSTTINIGNFIKFNKIYLSNTSIVEIISIKDSDGNEYYEVPNLTQNIVYKPLYSSEERPNYILKKESAQRRYLFDRDSDGPYLIFGGAQYKPDDDLTINPIAEPDKFILNKYNNDYLENQYFDPSALLNGDNFGIGPDNTTLTIQYRANNLSNNNAQIGIINKIDSLQYTFNANGTLTGTERDKILGSIVVANEEPILGQNNSISLNEIKDLAGQIFNSQGRAVTSKDYEALVHLMPQKYGAIKRVSAQRDPTSMKNNINLYIICTDENQFLAKSNTRIKENLKTWLSDYKIITDSIDIIDAKIINFAVNFTVKVDPSSNKSETLDLVYARLRSLFGIKPLIGQNFSILDVYKEIRKVESVLDILNLKIINKTSTGYSPTYFNVEQNTTNDGNFIKIPRNAIYEVRYLNGTDSDLIGKAI